MAISPNVDFVSGAILTATQQNQFPRGVMQLVEATSDAVLGAEAVTITAPSFTAVANRYYRITYFEPNITGAGTASTTTLRIRLTNAAGAIYGGAVVTGRGAAVPNMPMTVVAYTTLAAGATVIVGTGTTTGTSTATRTADLPAQLIIEDMGPA
jgi:hypothetical protein